MLLNIDSFQVLSSSSVFIIGFFIIFLMAHYFYVRRPMAAFLYLWHTAFCFIYVWYSSNNIADAVAYYNHSKVESLSFGLGTSFIPFFTSFFSQYLSLSYIGAFLVYNLIGTVGLLAFYAALQQATLGCGFKLRMAGVVTVLLPSISFWSSAIGKDSISFMATCLALWAALDLSSRYRLMVLAVVAMFLVRPHMAGLLIIALSLSFVLKTDISVRRRLFFGSFSLLAASFLVPFALQYAGLDSGAGFSGLVQYIEKRESLNQEGGGGVDISNMIFPAKVFTYFFRPLPFEVNSFFQLAASLDNVLLLALFFLAGKGFLGSKNNYAYSGDRVFLWTYVLIAWTILALVTANLGISVRQKWMFAPMMIFLLFTVLARQNSSVVNASKTFGR